MCSMISAQCAELRAMAESVGLAMPKAATLMMGAADTIEELRGALQVASADYRNLQAERDRLREEFDKMDVWHSKELTAAMAENAKLHELAHLVAEYVSEDQCEGCVAKRACNAGELDMCWIRKAILEKLRELGVDA